MYTRFQIVTFNRISGTISSVGVPVSLATARRVADKANEWDKSNGNPFVHIVQSV